MAGLKTEYLKKSMSTKIIFFRKFNIKKPSSTKRRSRKRVFIVGRHGKLEEKT